MITETGLPKHSYDIILLSYHGRIPLPVLADTEMFK